MHVCAWHAAYVCGVHICVCVCGVCEHMYLMFVYGFGCICLWVYECLCGECVLCGSMFVMNICSCAWVYMCEQVPMKTRGC